MRIELLMQVHDSLVFQYPAHMRNPVLRALRPVLNVPIPYPKPLTIRWGVSVSTKSWGHVKEIDWPT
jgi:DNA polymerase I-like protein with 3'-5' exonuclease and polymerase domains